MAMWREWHVACYTNRHPCCEWHAATGCISKREARKELRLWGWRFLGGPPDNPSWECPHCAAADD